MLGKYLHLQYRSRFIRWVRYGLGWRKL